MQQVSAGGCRVLQRLRGSLSFAAMMLPAEFGWCLWLETCSDCVVPTQQRVWKGLGFSW